MKQIMCLILLIVLSFPSSAAFSSADKKIQIKPNASRTGLNGKIEIIRDKVFETDFNQNSEINLINKNKPSNTIKSVEPLLKPISYLDFDIKELAKDAKFLTEETKTHDLENLRILWQSTIENSETIRFAIYKLSNPNGEEEKRGIVKKVLSPISSVAPIFGLGCGNVIAGSSTIIGGGLLNSVLSDDTFVNNKLSRVTDTELVLLAQQTDGLQEKLVKLYFDYKNALERLQKVNQIVDHRFELYQKAQKKTVEEISIADVFYREAVDLQYETKQEVLKNRTTLEQLVGNDTLIEVESRLKVNLSLI